MSADVAEAIARAHALSVQLGPVALQGADEGARMEEAAQIVLACVGRVPDAQRATAFRILWRTGHYEAAEQLGGFAELGRYCALNGQPGGLLNQFARVRTDADRLELLAQHRLWGETVERAAAGRPIEPPRRGGGDRVRLGFLSSDLRHHVVAYFAQPLFEHLDPRFELFAYSAFPGPADVVQQWLASRCTAYRQLPRDDHDAAQVIAADGLDLLVELGGPTPHARPAVLAYRPAPKQISWLGYPHSLGLAAIDHYLADACLAPPRADLLLETPLKMPGGWICMSPAAFQPQPAESHEPPSLRTGHVTFGTANDPYKFSPDVLRAWARVVAAVPGSRFMVVRPEAGAPSFRENMARHFAAEGVAADRLDFRPVRGGVRPLYAEMDIALDTFPLTGGTTTCEALWMGVPTVTLVGEAPYERLSWSILSHAGLPQFAATNRDDYTRVAVELAAAPARLGALRRMLRDTIRSRPLGQPRQFAADFYDLMAAQAR